MNLGRYWHVGHNWGGMAWKDKLTQGHLRSSVRQWLLRKWTKSVTGYLVSALPVIAVMFIKDPVML